MFPTDSIATAAATHPALIPQAGTRAASFGSGANSMPVQAIRAGSTVAIYQPEARRFIQITDEGSVGTSPTDVGIQLPAEWTRERFTVVVVVGARQVPVQGNGLPSLVVTLWNMQSKRFLAMDAEGMTTIQADKRAMNADVIPDGALWAVVDAGSGRVGLWSVDQKRFMRLEHQAGFGFRVPSASKVCVDAKMPDITESFKVMVGARLQALPSHLLVHALRRDRPRCDSEGCLFQVVAAKPDDQGEARAEPDNAVQGNVVRECRVCMLETVRTLPVTHTQTRVRTHAHTHMHSRTHAHKHKPARSGRCSECVCACAAAAPARSHVLVPAGDDRARALRPPAVPQVRRRRRGASMRHLPRGVHGRAASVRVKAEL